MDYLKVESYCYDEMVHVEGTEVIRVKFNYWVDENDVYWYSYTDICAMIDINENIANKKYEHEVPEDKKQVCWDSNQYDNHGHKLTLPTNYVTSDEAYNLIRSHTLYITKRDNAIIKVLNNLEFVGHSRIVYSDSEEIKTRMKMVRDSIENKDYEEFAHQCFMVSQTESAREVLDKRGIIDKEKEEYVDKYREMIYNPDVEEVESIGKLRKKEDAPTEEERKLLYTKNKNKEHKIPYWLKDLVK